MKILTFPDWPTKQHYKTRSAPWCKLYRSDLDDPAYRALSLSARGFLADLQRLAVEEDNRIPFSLDWLSHRTGADAESIAVLVHVLADASILAITDASTFASTALPLPLASVSREMRERKNGATPEIRPRSVHPSVRG